MKLADRVHAAISEGQKPPANKLPNGAWFCWVAERASCDTSDIGTGLSLMTTAQLESIGVNPEHLKKEGD